MSETLSTKPFDPANHIGQGFLRNNTAINEAKDALYDGSDNPFLKPVETESIINYSPEELSHQECIAQFYEAWKMPEDVSRRQLGDFVEVFVKLKDNLVDQTLFPRVGAVMKQYHWLYFSTQAVPLEDAAIINKSYEASSWRPNPLGLVSTEVPMTFKDAQVIVSEMYEKGLNQINDERREIRQADPNLVVKYLDVMKSSPQYRFLMSFDQAEDKLKDRPLTDFEKQMEAARAEADIRQRFGVPDNRRLSDHPTPAPRQALAKELYRIDDDVKQVRVTDADPLDRAKEFFLQDIKQWVEAEMPEVAGDIMTELLKNNYIDPFTQDQYVYELNRRLGGSDADIFNGQLMLDSFIDRLFDTKLVAANLDDCIKYFIKLYGMRPHAILNRVMERSLSAEQVINLRGGADSQNLKYVTMPAEEAVIKPISFFGLPNIYDIFLENNAKITNKDDIEVKRSHVMGNLEYRPGFYDDTTRIVEFEPVLDELLLRSEQAPATDFDLKITLAAPTQFMGRIAGYDLTALSGDEMYFKKSSDNDPYDQPERLLTDLERQNVEQIAAGLGAKQLTKYLRKQKRLSLINLAEAVSQTSDYSFDTSINKPESPIPGVGLKAGRLQMQCDGAAVVMRKLLDGLPGDTFIVGGLTVWSDKAFLSAAGHAQIEWTDSDGKQYRLDATPRQNGPSSGLGLEREQSVNRGRFIGRLLSRRNQVDLKFEQKPKVVPEQTVAAPPTFELMEIKRAAPSRAEIVDQIDFQLRALVSARDNQELYEKGIKLAAADPVRRTMEAALMVRKDRANELDLAGLDEYLVNLGKADAQLLKRIGIPKYQSGTLQMLQSFVQQLSSLTKV